MQPEGGGQSGWQVQSYFVLLHLLASKFHGVVLLLSPVKMNGSLMDPEDTRDICWIGTTDKAWGLGQMFLRVSNVKDHLIKVKL